MHERKFAAIFQPLDQVVVDLRGLTQGRLQDTISGPAHQGQ